MTRFAIGLSALLLLPGCFLTRSGTGANANDPTDAGVGAADTGTRPPTDAAPPPRDSGDRDSGHCPVGTADADGDPANGCECTLRSPPTELCNGIDDDCDPTTWDGFDDPLLGQPCDGADEDLCSGGTWVCNVDALACTDPLVNNDERCATPDDEDCDGSVDESTAVDARTYYLDADGDGYGDASMAASACTMPTGWVLDGTDCDDSSAARSPGVAETCNGRDDNCSGMADDTGCPCPVRHLAGVPYMFCTVATPWDNARDFCASHGYRLAKIETDAENTWVSNEARSLAAGGFWIGLRQSGDDWDWTDGSEAEFTRWAAGQPDDGNRILVTEDCVEVNAYANTTWNDQRCGRDRAFVCEWP